MISKIDFNKIESLVQDRQALNGFKHFKNKKHPLQCLNYKDEAVFAFIENKNGVFEGMTFFIKLENTNKIIKALKEYFNARVILYIMNKNREAVFDNIDDELIYLKLFKFVLQEKLIAFENRYTIGETNLNTDLECFFVECFEDEFDENAKVWLEDFESYDHKKEIKQIRINQEIAACIMYSIHEDSVFIFLLGTHPKFRRKKLAYILIQQVQENFPDKEIGLTTWAGGNTEKFYLRNGFKKMQQAHVCI